jgi:hypothetical protein
MVMGFCQHPEGVYGCLEEGINKYKTCGECPLFISQDEKQKRDFYMENPDFLEID